MLRGFTPPYTASGKSSLLRPPPWHFAGQVLSLAFEVSAAAAERLLPTGLQATGAAAAHFCEWQATTDGSELLDPVYAQYKEFFILLATEHEGENVFYCPFIYVDQDVSMVRGWLQGWPKKLGSIWMTRSYGVDHPAAAPLRKQTQLGASLAVKDRRLAETVITLTGETVAPIGFLATPTLALAGSPSLIGIPDPGERKLLRAAVSQKVAGESHGAAGSLRLFESPRDELSVLHPKAMKVASLTTVALSVTGAVAV